MLHCLSSIRRWLTIAALLLGAGTAPAMTVIAPTFDELVNSSDVVLRGVVSQIRTITVPTPEGEAIRTLVTLRVERALKGAPESEVTLSFLGGKVGRRTLRIVGMPTFTVGERQVLFVSGNGRVICPLYAAGHGRYFVRQDPATGQEYITRNDHAPLAAVEEVAHAFSEHRGPADLSSGMTLAAFEERIVSTLRTSGKANQR